MTDRRNPDVLAALEASHREADAARVNGDGFPELAVEARYGLAGRFLDATEQTTEADPAALLVTFLATFGALVGRGPHLRLANDPHPARYWPVLVGDSAKARKGTSWSVSRAVFAAAEPALMTRVKSGFGSGEALVDTLRDRDPGDDDDDGSTDERLLVLEAEWSRVLKVCAREGSTLSATIRDAYDGNPLQVRSRAKTSVATHHHVVCVGHVVADELARYLTSSEMAGGFANRHVFHRVRRVRRLPEGGNVAEQTVRHLAAAVVAALDRARSIGRMDWHPGALPLWYQLYYAMAEDEPGGLLGAIVARPEANVARLAVIYALLDGKQLIELDHLAAAWSVWEHGRASAGYLFADLSGDPELDRLLAALADVPDGIVGRDLNDLFGGHGKGVSVAERGIARQLVERVKESSGGRPRVVYRLAPKAPKAPKGGER